MRNELENPNLKLIGIKNSNTVFSIAQCFDIRQGVNELVKQWFKIIDDDPEEFKASWYKQFIDAKIIYLGYLDEKKGILKSFKHPDDLYIFNKQKLLKYVDDKIEQHRKVVEENVRKESCNIKPTIIN